MQVSPMSDLIKEEIIKLNQKGKERERERESNNFLFPWSGTVLNGMNGILKS